MKIALVTGGSRGIGKSIALHSAERNIGIILTYNTAKDEADKVVQEIKTKGGKAVALQLDTGKSESFQNFSSQIKSTLKNEFNREDFDILINNAGIAGNRGSIIETTEKDFDEVVNVNLKGPFFLTQKLIPLIAEGGHIVNISSGLARFAFPNVAVYGALKSALEGFTRYFAKEFASRKIRANSIAPGPVDTEFGGGKNPQAVKAMSEMTALGRIANADDVGLFVAGFITEDGRFITGQRIEISGGIFI
jgi:NAD(P)-dependent dehydrogenase (short-subunit alcohol dehydrogenase family)